MHNVNILPMPKMTRDQILRFLSNYKQLDNGCWRWLGSPIRNGYGTIKINYIGYLAHRISYFLHYNVDPGQLLVLHECDNRWCVNPEHLFLGTYKDNAEDCANKGRRPKLFGEENHVTKISWSDICEIREAKVTQEETAKMYGISASMVSHIKNMRTRVHG